MNHPPATSTGVKKQSVSATTTHDTQGLPTFTTTNTTTTTTNNNNNNNIILNAAQFEEKVSLSLPTKSLLEASPPLARDKNGREDGSSCPRKSEGPQLVVTPSFSNEATASAGEPFTMPLKGEHGSSCDDNTVDGNGGEEKESKKTLVVFDKTVSVIPIPSHKDYSKELKQSMWSTKRELAANASRNLVEFAAEGWDWRNVITEEEGMILNPSTGDYMHPIHLVQEQEPPEDSNSSSSHLRDHELCSTSSSSSSSSSSSCANVAIFKPKPRRPRHPSLIYDIDDLLKADLGVEWDPISRRITPTPFFSE